MTTCRRTAGYLAAVVGLAVVLAGCSADGGTTTSEEAEDFDAGPMQQLFGDLGDDLFLRELVDEQLKTEELVAQCMSEQGWEYTPVLADADGGGVITAPFEDEEGPGWGTEEYAAQYGYGITSSMLEEAEGDAAPPAEPAGDPNEAYVASLSPAAQSEYEVDLDGVAPSADDVASGEWEYDPDQSGCRGWATAEFERQGSVWEDARFTALFEDMDRMYATVMDDPRVGEATSAWAACMADAGYPGLTDENSSSGLVFDELQSFWNAGTEPNTEEMAEIHEMELAIASADFACRRDSELIAVTDEIRHEAEEQFITQHRTELEQLVESLEN